jgi:hypothetical protein
MRGLRILAQDVWYEVRTSVNNSEPLFWTKPNRDLFRQGLYEVRQIYGFELSGLGFSGPQVSFYLKPTDGFQLPEIMQWIKQTFAVRFNVIDGRTGHIWGDRYWSEILSGEPPEWAEAYVFVPVVCGWRKGWRRIAAGGVGRRLRNRLRETLRLDTRVRRAIRRGRGSLPRLGERTRNSRIPPILPRRTTASRS